VHALNPFLLAFLFIKSTLKMVLGNTFVQNATLSDLLIVVILGWTLVPLWSRYIDNLTFNSMGLDVKSTYQTLIIAIITTALFLIFVYTFDTVNGNLVESSGEFSPPIPVGTSKSL
jgi:hypothetical protein